MPTKPPTPSNVVEILLMHGAGSVLNMGTKLYWTYSGSAPNAAGCLTLAGSIGSAWNSNLAAFLTNNGVLESVTVTDLASATGASATSTTTHTGTRTGSQPTQGTCAIINYHVARKYRGGKPKGFWPLGVASDLSTEQTWSSTFVTNLTTAYLAFQTAVNGLVGGSATLGAQCNVSYFSGSTSNPNSSKWARRNIPSLRGTPVVDPVTAISVRQTLGSQRRRINR